MTIQQLLETQNIATACKVKYTYVADTTVHQDAGSASAIQTDQLMLDYTESVCYSPIDGILYQSYLVGLFILVAFIVVKWFRPKPK